MKTNFRIIFIDGSEIDYDLQKDIFCFVGKIAHLFLGLQIKSKLNNRELLRTIFKVNKTAKNNGISNTILERI